MKRRNVQLAFTGEGASPTRDMEIGAAGDEAIDVAVRGGKLMVVVPSGTPDEEMFRKASVLGGELTLENGLHLTFEIMGDATGAQFDVSPGEQRDTHPGLSALPNIPGGT